MVTNTLEEFPVFPALLPRVPCRGARCPRCGHRYSKDQGACPHCSDLSDGELGAKREEWADQREAGRRFGWFLMMLAAVFLGVVIVLLVAM